MNQPIFEESDFAWTHMLSTGMIKIMPNGHVTAHNGVCTTVCPHCNPKAKEKLPLILQAALTEQGVA